MKKSLEINALAIPRKGSSDVRGEILASKSCWGNWIAVKRLKLDFKKSLNSRINHKCITDINKKKIRRA